MKYMKTSYVSWMILLMAWLLPSSICVASEQDSKACQQVMALMEKHKLSEEDVQVFRQGEGLNLIKMMLGKEMGKKFLKEIDLIAIFMYSELNEQQLQAIHQDFDTQLTAFEEMDLSEEELEENYVRFFYVSINDDDLSDFLTIMEDTKSEMRILMYFHGKMPFDEASQK